MSPVRSSAASFGHEAWLATLKVPVLRLDSAAPLEDLVFAVLSRLETGSNPPLVSTL